MGFDSSPPRCMSFNEGEGNFCDLTFSLDEFYFGKRSGVRLDIKCANHPLTSPLTCNIERALVE